MKIKSLIFIISIFLINCQTKEEQKISANSIIYPLEQSISVTNLENFIDTIIMIPLETSSESLLGNITKILLTVQNEIIILNSSKIFVFNSNGTFSHYIGKSGRGPGEHTGIMDICLSQDNQYILALDYINNVHKYRLNDGSFILKNNIKLPKGYTDYHNICPSSGDGFFLYCCNKTNKSKRSDTFYCLNEYNSKGEIIHQYLPENNYILPITPITQTYNNEYLIRPQENNHICYRLKDNQVIPWLKIDFQNESIPETIFKQRFSKEFEIKDFMFSNYCKLPIYIYNTSEYLYFSYCGPNAINCYFVYSQNTQKGIRWSREASDVFDSYIPYVVASDSIYFYTIFNDYTDYKNTSLNSYQISDPLKKYIVSKIAPSINEDENPYLMKIKFKI